MEEKYREKSIARRMEKCIHFTGTQHEKCKMGVVYETLEPIPCIGRWGNVEPKHCDKLELTTREQAERDYDEMHAQSQETMTAVNAAHVDAKAKGLGVKHGGRSTMACPTGCGGMLHYTVASVNGHMHAMCSTPDCVRWME